jgi:hypothetical protein
LHERTRGRGGLQPGRTAHRLCSGEKNRQNGKELPVAWGELHDGQDQTICRLERMGTLLGKPRRGVAQMMDQVWA